MKNKIHSSHCLDNVNTHKNNTKQYKNHISREKKNPKSVLVSTPAKAMTAVSLLYRFIGLLDNM